MFVHTTSYEFQRTVEVRRPSPDKKDAILRETFVARFKAIEPDELEAFEDELAQTVTAKDSIGVLSDLAARVTVGWEDVVDGDKKPVAFTEELFRQYLRAPWFRDGVVSAYRSAMRGEEARLGN